MSDDAPRSAQGNRPDQRRGRGAPVWWDMLQRSDLPDDPKDMEGGGGGLGWNARLVGPVRAPRNRRATVLSVLAAVGAAIAIAIALWLTTAASQHSAGNTAAVIVGVPAILLGTWLVATLLSRRRRD
jgi:hypothetical protein